MDQPKTYPGIMVSSTFTDLSDHRQKLIEAIQHCGMMPIAMEHSGARADADVIDTSLKMVRDSTAYIGLISHKYGQTPFDEDRNPSRLSITELEFNEAMRLSRPILLFIMSDKHPGVKADFELDPEKSRKLDEFRSRAKRMREGSEVERVYEVFASPEDFATRAGIAVGRLKEHLGLGGDSSAPSVDEEAGDEPIRPPNLAAFPRYLGSHQFVGRASELQTLGDWCGAADPNPMLLFQAMGGSGKSMLTWEWLSRHATAARPDWAGRFWYSFYEQGAVMAGFCRQALAYMTARPLEEFAKLRTPQLAERLIAQLEKRPWLLVLDGLERVLVAYHRYDAAQVRDDEVDTSTDPIGERNPCAAIRPDDDDLLRRLAAAGPSKILVSSRLTPAVLMNRSGFPVPGVRREFLQGLRPADAETFIRSCGISGRSNLIQTYLKMNCDCHPLVVGALAGLVNDYPFDRGNFDRWADDAKYGAALNLAHLELKQRQTHILFAAVDALASESRQLLQTLSLLQGGANFETLQAFNPHLPPKPEEVSEPTDPAKFWKWDGEEERRALKADFEEQRFRHQAYTKALAAWENDPKTLRAHADLSRTLIDIERRGLLQYDGSGKRYDLHPVVRGIVAGRMEDEQTERLGRQVVDHFESRPHVAWENAQTLEDLKDGLQVVRTLLRMRSYSRALSALQGDLANALHFNLSATSELLSVVQAFFPNGLSGEPVQLGAAAQNYLLGVAGQLSSPDLPNLARHLLQQALLTSIRMNSGRSTAFDLLSLANASYRENKLTESSRLMSLASLLAEATCDIIVIFISKLESFGLAVVLGNVREADRLWLEIDASDRPANRAQYRPGEAESWRALQLFYRGQLNERILSEAESLATMGRSRDVIRDLHRLRGEWHLSRGEARQAVEAIGRAVSMAREVASEDIVAEAFLAIAHLRSGSAFDARGVAERLSAANYAPYALAELWHALGEPERAIEAALNAHRIYAADGEPYVRRYDLDRTRALLTELRAPLPDVPKYDPSDTVLYPWEKDVQDFIEKLRTEHDANAKKTLDQ